MQEKPQDIISAWERDPDQGFTFAEMKILIEKGCVKSQIESTLSQ